LPLLLATFISIAQYTAAIHELKQSSNENYDMLIVAIVAFVLLIILYFIFPRKRKK
jgi:uncharacterized BrkB/YihY/UPF0761 family membrane protein